MNILNKYKNMSVQAKAAIWFAACSILQKGISFITVPIFTRLLTTEEYGTYSLYLSWLSVLSIITSLYLFNGVLNNAMVKFVEDRDKYISSMQGLTVTISTTVFLIFLCFQNKWEFLFGLAPIYIYLMFFEAVVTPSLSYWSCKQRFEYKYKKLVIITLIKSLLNPLLGLVAVSFANDKAIGRVISVVIVEFAFCGAIMVIQFIRGKNYFDKKYWKYALLLGLPLLPHYLSGLILNQADRIMIEKMVGRTEVAFYSVSYNIGMLIQVFTVAIGNAITPWMYEKIKGKDYNGISKTINSLLLIIAFIAFALMLCSPEVVIILGSEEYASAVYVIPPVAASTFFIFLYNLLAIPQFYYEKTKYMLFASLFAALANIGLNYFFINHFGYVAAGYTTLICYIIYSIGHCFISTKIINKESPGMASQLYDMKTIFVLSLLIIIFEISCNFIFDYWYIRYALILLVIVLFVVFKEKIIRLFGQLKKK